MATAIKTFGAVKEENLSFAPQLSVSGSTSNSINLTWNKAPFDSSLYKVVMVGAGPDEKEEPKVVYIGKDTKCRVEGLEKEREYSFRVQTGTQDLYGSLSCPVIGKTTGMLEYKGGWKECPDYVYEWMKYALNKENPRTATLVGCEGYGTIIGNTPLPQNKVTSWSIKILKSKKNNGEGILIGVAPSDINQNAAYNFMDYGWYFDCCSSKLWSGPPCPYREKAYGPRKKEGQYVHTGDSVGVVMDTTKAKGELSFVLNGVNLGVAYEGIPLDKPLVPCALLGYMGDSVELIT